MTELPGHVAAEKLQHYLDGTLDPTDRQAVGAHLDACPVCRAALGSFSRIDASLKRFPRERASRSLAASVLDSLNLSPRRDRTFELLRHTGAAFAFLVVSAILVGVFAWTGVIDLGGGDADGGTSGLLAGAGDSFAGAAQGAGAMMAKFFAYFSSQGGAAVLLFGVAVVGILGAADFFFRRSSLRH